MRIKSTKDGAKRYVVKEHDAEGGGTSASYLPTFSFTIAFRMDGRHYSMVLSRLEAQTLVNHIKASLGRSL